MRHYFNWLLGAIILIVGILRPVRAELTDRQVRQAIGEGVRYLLSQQDKVKGKWPEHPGQPGGLTSLVVLALLNSGLEPGHPDVQRGLDYLRSLPAPQRTYASAVMVMAFCAAEPKRDRLLIEREAKWLQSIQIRSGPNAGAWAYGQSLGGGDFEQSGDNSNSQFALLALHEAESAGIPVAREVWERARTYWESCQHPGGGWSYYKGGPAGRPTGSMTCAGISSLIISSGKLANAEAQVNGDRILCCGAESADDRIQRGLDWLGKHFSVARNPNTGDSKHYLLYYLYGLERVGRLSGRRFVGRHDWYREGVEFLVTQSQDRLSGRFRGEGRVEGNGVVSTAFALLFLSKGRRPVVLSRVQHGEQAGEQQGDWNHHRGAVPTLVKRIERVWQRDLTWQTVNLQAAGTNDLLQSPVLFLSGKQALRIGPREREQLREYVNQGGFLFVEACHGNGCDGTAFDQSFRNLMSELFPESPLRRLGPDHAVWFAEQPIVPGDLPAGLELWGVDACCRTSVVYCPFSLSCHWELAELRRYDSYPPAARGQIEACVRIGQNVIAYATNRELKAKLDRPQVAAAAGPAETLERGVLVIPKLNHGGGADDAPNALTNLLAGARQLLDMRIDPQKRVLSPQDDTLYKYPLLFMHGRRAFRFSEGERRALKDYLDRGGFLLADAICASDAFAESVRQELAAIYPEGRFHRIAPEHELFSPRFDGFDIRNVTLRDPKLRGQQERLEARRAKTTPLLEAFQVNGRIAVVLSPYDLSCALENQTSLQCKGYIKQDAARIAINVILYGLQQP